jgi:membrane protein implicated in regulation of membrane protease activity
MTFFVTKSLATGPIRFGVAPRRLVEAIDHDPALSTGPDGSFIRRRRESFFFADSRNVASASALPRRHTEQTLIDQVLALPKPLLALVPIGAVFLLLGLAVLFTKGAQGLIEVIFGLAMIAVPIVITAQQRRAVREREEKERAEREERERRDSELLGKYVAALEQMRINPTQEAMDAVARERAAIDLPDSIWSPAARLAVLQIGLEALHRLGPSKAAEVAQIMAETGGAAGLHGDAKISLREDLYLVVLWHLLADDRLGPVQSAELEKLRTGFDIDINEPAQEQFERLRGIGVRNLPRAECSARLGFHEYCIHATKELFITNKRVLFPSQKPSEIGLQKIDDIAVDADTSTMVLKVAGVKKPLSLTLEDPIFVASFIDIATSINERPRGFA